jgi:hypothetical protein
MSEIQKFIELSKKYHWYYANDESYLVEKTDSGEYLVFDDTGDKISCEFCGNQMYIENGDIYCGHCD